MKTEVKHYFRTGFSQAGSVIGFILSWATNHSIIWGLIHACLGWLYIVYWALKYSDLERLIRVWLMK